MKPTQLIIARNLIFLLSILALSVQLFLLQNITDLFCLSLLFFSNIFTIFYCFNKKYFFEYPITLIIIFFSHFMNLGAVLYLKSIELSLVTSKLNLPLSTILDLTVFNLIIITSHSLYRKSNIANNINKKIKFFFIKINFFNFENKKFFLLLSFIAILSKLLIYDLNTPYYLQRTGEVSIFKDILNGMNYLIFIPIIILFNKYFQNKKNLKINNLYFLIYITFLIFISLARNNRSILFDFFLLTILVFIFLFLLNKIQLNKKNYLIFFIISFLIFPFSSKLDKLSTHYLIERQNYFDRSPIENVSSFIKTLFSKSDRQLLYLEKKVNNYDLYSEVNYSINFLNRISIIKVHDNFNYINKNISSNKLQELKKIQINKIISTLPAPLIKIFKNDFDKFKYISLSTASYLYGSFINDGSRLNMGSALMTMKIIFGLWIYIILLFCFIPVFIFFDSFYDKEKNLLSPYIVIFFYATSMGMFNFFAASEISLWFSYILRTIPQTMLIIILIRFIFNLLTKKVI